MKAFWIDRETNTAKFVDTDASLDALYDMCHCRCIDIATVKVCGIWMDFVVDDEGLLVDGPKASVFDQSGQPMLVGSVVVLSSDEDGDFAGLDDEQAEAIALRTTSVIIVNRDIDIEERVVMFAD